MDFPRWPLASSPPHSLLKLALLASTVLVIGASAIALALALTPGVGLWARAATLLGGPLECIWSLSSWIALSLQVL